MMDTVLRDTPHHKSWKREGHLAPPLADGNAGAIEAAYHLGGERRARFDRAIPATGPAIKPATGLATGLSTRPATAPGKGTGMSIGVAAFMMRAMTPVAQVPDTLRNFAKPRRAYKAPKARRLFPGEAIKRTLDLTGAGLGLVVLSPLFASLALAVRFGPEGGRVLYGHTRIGRDGRTFKCWKFRTMVENGEEVLQSHLSADPQARLEWETTRKLKDDPRVTRLGQVLRKLSIDELPQLINVLRGEMSLVGPRPVVDDELARYGRSAPHYLRSRPGLTGLWQVSGRNDVDYRRRVALDRWYASNGSLLTDAAIIARTVPVVCLARGSY